MQGRQVVNCLRKHQTISMVEVHFFIYNELEAACFIIYNVSKLKVAALPTCLTVLLSCIKMHLELLSYLH